MENWNIYNLFNTKKSIKAGSTTKDDTIEYSNSLALHTGEKRDLILKNRENFMKYFDDSFKFISLEQIHSANVAIINQTQLKDRWSELKLNADGLVTNVKGIVLTILTADCAAIIAYDEKNSIIGAAHAGWRGTKDNIALNLIDKMQELGASKENIIVAISPCIKSCCYEVGEDVAKYFLNYSDALTKTSNNKWHLDISIVNKNILVDYGIKEKNIEISNICTACESKRYFSYRKECGCSGRFITYIAMK